MVCRGPGGDLYLSVLVVGEIRNGIERLRRRDPVAAARLETWLASVQTDLASRILPVTTGIADRWGRLRGSRLRTRHRRLAGRNRP